jgi:hypothetical protein
MGYDGTRGFEESCAGEANLSKQVLYSHVVVGPRGRCCAGSIEQPRNGDVLEDPSLVV